MEQVERLLSLDIMSRQKFGGKSEKIYFSLGKFVSALRHKRCIMHRMQCRKEENYVKKDTVFLLEYERQGKGEAGNYDNDSGCFQHDDLSWFFGKKPRYIKAKGGRGAYGNRCI